MLLESQNVTQSLRTVISVFFSQSGQCAWGVIVTEWIFSCLQKLVSKSLLGEGAGEAPRSPSDYLLSLGKGGRVKVNSRGLDSGLHCRYSHAIEREVGAQP